MAFRILSAMVFLAFAAPRAAADESALGQPITDPAEIVGRMAGNTLSGIWKETGKRWAEFYCDSGHSIYLFGGISLGKWWAKDGKVCFAYDDDNYQQPGCYQLYGRDDGSLVFLGRDDAGRSLTFISGPPRPGDPLHLEQRAPHGCALEPSV